MKNIIKNKRTGFIKVLITMLTLSSISSVVFAKKVSQEDFFSKERTCHLTNIKGKKLNADLILKIQRVITVENNEVQSQTDDFVFQVVWSEDGRSSIEGSVALNYGEFVDGFYMLDFGDSSIRVLSKSKNLFGFQYKLNDEVFSNVRMSDGGSYPDGDYIYLDQLFSKFVATGSESGTITPEVYFICK